MIRDEDQPWARGPAYVMTGSNTFWFSTIWMSPGTDRVYAVISNRGATESATANNDVVVHMLEERL